jgi:hypothetical protein
VDAALDGNPRRAELLGDAVRTVVVERLLDEKTSLTLRVEALRRSLPGTGCPGRRARGCR